MKLEQLQTGYEFYCCPLLLGLSLNTVMISNHPIPAQKYTAYDEESLQTALKRNNVCPMTRTTLTDWRLISVQLEVTTFLLEAEKWLSSQPVEAEPLLDANTIKDITSTLTQIRENSPDLIEQAESNLTSLAKNDEPKHLTLDSIGRLIGFGVPGNYSQQQKYHDSKEQAEKEKKATAEKAELEELRRRLQEETRANAVLKQEIAQREAQKQERTSGVIGQNPFGFYNGPVRNIPNARDHRLSSILPRPAYGPFEPAAAPPYAPLSNQSHALGGLGGRHYSAGAAAALPYAPLSKQSHALGGLGGGHYPAGAAAALPYAPLSKQSHAHGGLGGGHYPAGAAAALPYAPLSKQSHAHGGLGGGHYPAGAAAASPIANKQKKAACSVDATVDSSKKYAMTWISDDRLFESRPIMRLNSDDYPTTDDYEKMLNYPRVWFERYKKNSGHEVIYKLFVNGEFPCLVRLSRASRTEAIRLARLRQLGGESLAAATGGCNEPRHVCGKLVELEFIPERGHWVANATLDFYDEVLKTYQLRKQNDRFTFSDINELEQCFFQNSESTSPENVERAPSNVTEDCCDMKTPGGAR